MNNEIERLKRDNARMREHLEISEKLLKACSNQVGSILGEEIAEYVASVKGVRHNAAEWNQQDTNGEQGR